MSFTIIRGTDWRGDAYWNVYDNNLRTTIGPRFYAEVHAQDYIEAHNKK